MTALLTFVVILVGLVLVHEIGHFVTAKLAGVRVQEFGVGYPPRIFAVRLGETEYSLNLLPLGGFVKMLGEEDPSEKDSLASKSIPVRMLILSAGSAMNALLPFLLFSLSLMVPQDTATGPVVVNQVAPNSPAAMAGIKPGDTILRINDRRIQNTRDLSYSIQLNLGSEVTMLLKRDRFTQETVKVVPRWNPPQGQGATGIAVSMTSVYRTTQAYPVWEAVPLGLRGTLDTLTLTKNEIIGWFVRGITPQVAGPIGIAQMTGEVAKVGIGSLLEFAGLLSINLAVLNILPFPMLDGGRLAFVLLEGLRGGKRVSPEREGLVHLIGFALILTMVVIVSYYDILRIVRGESLFP